MSDAGAVPKICSSIIIVIHVFSFLVIVVFIDEAGLPEESMESLKVC